MNIVVVLDTTAFVADFHQSGGHWSVLMAAIRRGDCSIAVPQVVLDETAAKFRDQLWEAVGLGKKAASQIARLVNNQVAPPSADVNAAADHYSRQLASLLANLRASILPYPDIAHETVVSRALTRAKPFNDSGAGYRDYLIWRSITDFVRNRDAPVVFVTGNIRDFAESGRLHPDLAREMESEGIPSSRVSIAAGLREFNEAHVLPRLRAMEVLGKELTTNLQFRGWVSASINGLLADDDILSWVIGVPPFIGEVSDLKLERFKAARVIDARELDEDTIAARVELDLAVQFRISFTREEVEEDAYVRGLVGDEDTTEAASWVEHGDVTAQVQLTLEKPQHSVSAWDVLDVRTA